jgi:DNA-binding HxlR family transcriptional regulator
VPSNDDYCPVAKSVEVVGDRWCLLLVREMLRGVRWFNELQRCVPGISRSVLAQRLRHLERAGIAERLRATNERTIEYRLTERGRGLGRVVGALNEWGVQWLVPNARPTGMDPDGLMLWIRRHVALDRLPARRVVVAFEVRARRPRYYWLILQPGEASLCPEHPGFDEDVRIAADPATLYGLFLGRLALGDAIRDGTVQIDGPSTVVRALPGWFRLIPASS